MRVPSCGYTVITVFSGVPAMGQKVSQTKQFSWQLGGFLPCGDWESSLLFMAMPPASFNEQIKKLELYS